MPHPDIDDFEQNLDPGRARFVEAVTEGTLMRVLPSARRGRVLITRGGRAHAKLFGQARPVATMVVVAALLDPAWRVAIEVEAQVRVRSPPDRRPGC